MAVMDLPLREIREQVASSVDLIIQISRLSYGTRRITHITEVVGMEADIVTLLELFVFDFRAGQDENGEGGEDGRNGAEGHGGNLLERAGRPGNPAMGSRPGSGRSLPAARAWRVERTPSGPGIPPRAARKRRNAGPQAWYPDCSPPEKRPVGATGTHDWLSRSKCALSAPSGVGVSSEER